MTREKFFGIWTVPAAIVSDRVLKALAANMTSPRALVPGVLGASYAENTGAAFSIFSGSTRALSVFTAALIAAVTLYLLLGKRIPKLCRVGLWLVVAGGLSNLYDRIFLGYVIDYFKLLFMNFAVFNFADICVCLGAVFAFIAVFFDERTRKNAQKN